MEQPIPAVKSLNYFHHTHYFLCVRRWCPFFRAIIDIKYKNGLRVSVQFYRAIAGVDKLVFLPPKAQIELQSNSWWPRKSFKNIYPAMGGRAVWWQMGLPSLHHHVNPFDLISLQTACRLLILCYWQKMWVQEAISLPGIGHPLFLPSLNDSIGTFLRTLP